LSCTYTDKASIIDNSKKNKEEQKTKKLLCYFVRQKEAFCAGKILTCKDRRKKMFNTILINVHNRQDEKN
jgi:hypothetical protein